MLASMSTPMPFEEVDQADALDHLAGALVLERVLGEEVDHLLASSTSAS
jgi:hypothetical protein